MNKKTIAYLSIIIIVIGSIFLANGLILAWTSPTASPPGDNVAAPLNTGAIGQSKSGGLILNTGGAATGLVVDHGNVGIGTASPGAKLTVYGDSGGGNEDAAQMIRLGSGSSSDFKIYRGRLDGDLHFDSTQGGAYGGYFFKASGSNLMIIENNGNLWIRGYYSSPYCDIAERYESTQDSQQLEPGDIVVLDQEQEKKIKKSSHSYSALVIGVISTNPSMTMGVLGDNSNEGHPPVALLGRVPTKVTTENGPIKIGDLIVSSSKPGYGMKCDDYEKCQGAVVGKALQNFDNGKGLIEVLIKGGF